MNYEFSVLHNSANKNMQHLIEKYGVPEIVVEIGVFTGHFTFNMIDFIVPKRPAYKHYAVDPFSEVDENDKENYDKEGYNKFIKNLEMCPNKSHIEFMRKTSKDALYELYNRGVKAHLIYVDGDHRSPEVLQDLVLAWNILAIGGVMLCDDVFHWYMSDTNQRAINFTPKLAIDSFTNCYWNKIDVLQLPDNYQYAFIKTKE